MNKKLMLIALISIIISFISCGEADLNPCYSIKCVDNQYCLDGSCIDVQPESLEFIKPPIPLKIFITSIVFKKIPMVKSSGATWDTGNLPNSAPDLNIIMTQTGTNLFWKTPTPLDNTNQLPLSINLSSPIEITNVKALISINVYDYDTPSFSDFVGGIFFTPYADGNNYPEKISLDNGLIAVDFDITYEFR